MSAAASMQAPAGQRWREVVVDDLVRDGEVVLLALRAADGLPLPPYRAGAHIDVVLPCGLVRQYSLCGADGGAGGYRIGVGRASPSRGGSQWLHEHLAPGARLQIGAPRHLFELSGQATSHRFLAAGIGITPLLAMAWALDRASESSFTLHYFVRSIRQGAFVNEIRTSRFAARARIIEGDRETARACLPGVLQAPMPGEHLYVCGPDGFMTLAVDIARQAGWRADQIHTEAFAAPVDTGGPAFTVVAQKSGKRVTVTDRQTIADALDAAGVRLNLSCGQGVCGTCLTRVVSGTPEHRDSFQTDAEQRANTHITICCSRSRDEVLVLDI